MASASKACRVLIVDDDVSTRDSFTELLRDHGFSIATASSGRAGVQLATGSEYAAVLIDLRLPDISGLEVLSRIQRSRPAPPCIMVSGYASTKVVVQCLRLGAVDFLDKPVASDDLVSTLTRAVSAPPIPLSQDFIPAEVHAAARWAFLVTRAIDSTTDPRTLTIWGRAVGASTGTVRNWCRTAGVPAKHSLAFTRLLRAVVRRQQHGGRPEDLLDVVDRRTLVKLLRLGQRGQPRVPEFPSTIDDFLERQQWISEPIAVAQIRRSLGLDHGRRHDPLPSSAAN